MSSAGYARRVRAPSVEAPSGGRKAPSSANSVPSTSAGVALVLPVRKTARDNRSSTGPRSVYQAHLSTLRRDGFVSAFARLGNGCFDLGHQLWYEKLSTPLRPRTNRDSGHVRHPRLSGAYPCHVEIDQHPMRSSWLRNRFKDRIHVRH